MEDSHHGEDIREVQKPLNLGISANLKEGINELLEADSNLGDYKKLEPLRVYSASHLRTMYILKQYEDCLNLFDQYDINSEKSIEKEMEHLYNENSNNALQSGLISFLSVCGFLAIRRASPLKLNSFIENIYAIPIVATLPYTYLRMRFHKRQQNDSKIKEHEFNIVETKANLHTYCTQLTNILKYPVTELV